MDPLAYSSVDVNDEAVTMTDLQGCVLRYDGRAVHIPDRRGILEDATWGEADLGCGPGHFVLGSPPRAVKLS